MNPSKLLPDYPRTRHLCHKPNAQRLDLISTEKECEVIFNNDNVYFEEKVDGASVGLCYYQNNPIIRNRNNFLQKGKSGHLRTPAKLQFAPIWNFFYENVHKFDKLNELAGFEASIYGEWMMALHGVIYDRLPSYLMTYDVYDWTCDKFLDPGEARNLLTTAGFDVVPLLHRGKIPNFEFLENFMKEKSPFSTSDLREGVYVKVSDGRYMTDRFKWVRSDFIQGCHWSERKLTKNKLE
jgi:RNA ligase